MMSGNYNITGTNIRFYVPIPNLAQIYDPTKELYIRVGNMTIQPFLQNDVVEC